MFKINMKFTRAACWINSNISNRDNSSTFMIFLCCHYCRLLLCRNYWRFLLIHDGGPYHIETSPFICPENQWTGFCMIATFIMKELVLWNSTSRACYKLIVQLQLAVHQCELFFINDRNMADNTVESHLFCVECKIKSKKIDPKTL